MIILSDLHLGAGDQADDFGCAHGPQDLALVEFLREHSALRPRALPGDDSRRGRELIILAGDTADLAQASEAEIRAAHPLAVNAIVTYAHVLLRGNHDDVPKLFGRPTREAVLWQDTLVMHGHQFDPLNYGRWRFVGWAGSAAAGLIERVVGRDADVSLERRLAKWCGSGRFGDPERYRRRALRYVRRVYGARRIVLGHTHHWEPLLGRRYANAGTWTGGRRDAVAL